MKPIRERLTTLKSYVDLQTYAAERTPEPTSLVKMDEAIRAGIADLDFDPVYFLATGQESKEGWSK